MAFKFLKNKYVRINLVLLLFASILAGVIALVIYANKKMFAENQHFVLRHIEVSSTGWWNKRSDEIKKVLELNDKEVNLFALNLKAIRKKLETEPSISSVKVQRVLPDTLKISIIENIPRAFLGSKDSAWLVDNDAVIMSKKKCVNLSGTIPVIINLPDGIKFEQGEVVEAAKPALELSRLVRRQFPDFRITAMSVSKSDCINYVLYYKNDEIPYTVQMPNKQMLFYLQRLKEAIKKAKSENNEKRIVNLLFDGIAVLKYAPWQKKLTESTNGN